MKSNNIKIYIVLFAFLGFAGISRANEQQDISKSFKVSKGGLLKVTLMNGNVSITSWDKLEVSVYIEGAGDKEANQIKINQSGNTITVDDNGGWGWSNDKDVKVKVPVDFNASVNTNAGDITVSDKLGGYFKAFSGGGDITAKDISGATDISTNGGDISVSNIGNDVNLSTKGGDVHCANISGKAEINTMGGSVKMGNVTGSASVSTFGGDISTGNIGGKAEIKTLGGSINVNRVSGDANLSTNGGDVNLEGASGSVTAKTLGGNVKLKNIKGSVNAKTNSGDVSVELTPSGKSESRISTLNGGITLYVPSTAKVNINARVRAYGWWTSGDENKYIISDFKAKSMESSDHSNGVRATYILNGGGETIELTSVNDKIRIKQLNK